MTSDRCSLCSVDEEERMWLTSVLHVMRYKTGPKAIIEILKHPTQIPIIRVVKHETFFTEKPTVCVTPST